MAAYITFQPTDHYATKTYDGNSSTNAQTGVGFQPALTVNKLREPSGEAFKVQDSIRTAGYYMNWNNTNADSSGGGMASFDADGFTMSGANNAWNYGISGNYYPYCSWNWKMGTTSGVSFGSADITPSSYSIDTTTNSGIYKYSGNGSSAQTVAHGLGVKPDFVTIKRLEDNGHGWQASNTRNGYGVALRMESDAANNTSASWWNNTAPTTDVVNIGGDTWNNLSGKTFMMYCFTNKRGFFHTSWYKGNGDADGPFVYLGFRPALLWIKNSETVSDWYVWDNKRPTTSGQGIAASYWNSNATVLSQNATTAEVTNHGAAEHPIDFLSNGFKVRTTSSARNGDGYQILYAAWAEFPCVSSNSKPGVAR